MAELKTYNSKRNFTETDEPRGKKSKKSSGRLKFAVQHHLASRDHYDLRLEWDGVLLSWAIPKGPSFDTRDRRLAVRVEDHPIDYADFEGTIPKGEYGGGTVMLWDEGYWEPQPGYNPDQSPDSIKTELFGERLKGRWALVRMKPHEGEKADNWLLIKEKDDFAQKIPGISEFDTGVRSGRTMEEIAAGAPSKNREKKLPALPFEHTEPQLSEQASAVPSQGDWLYEIKYDGYRIIAYKDSGGVRLISRGGKDYTEKFPEIAKSLAAFKEFDCGVLDGEVAVFGEDGRSDFPALQNYIKHPKSARPVYMVFDILARGSDDLRELPLHKRKDMLEKLLKKSPPELLYSAHIRGNGAEFFRAACDAKLEGIIGKKADSPYTGTRNGDWIKIKWDNREEFVIGGYTVSDKRAFGISSILLGYYDGKKLVYCGRASGFSEVEMAELLKKFGKIVRKTSPFENSPKPRAGEDTVFLTPKYAAWVRFATVTNEGVLRQASYKGLREDKDVKTITDTFKTRPETHAREKEKSAPKKSSAPKPAEKPLPAVPTKKRAIKTSVSDYPLTSPEKLLFEQPPVTKLQVAEYYLKISERIMPFLEKRILSTVRCPSGISGECFFRKHPTPDAHGIGLVPIENTKGETSDYFYIKNIEGLMYEVQMNTIEFHTWGSRSTAPEKPDMIVFDLDPDEGLLPEHVRRGVRDLKRLLDDLGLVSYLKTSGGKGYHVVVPIKPVSDWETVKNFSKNAVLAAEATYPDLYTSNMRKEKRAEKIFIDWVRNGKGATSVAPYSLRARPGAKVSAPIAWRELDSVEPDGVDMADAIRRLKLKDPWAGFFDTDQNIKNIKPR